MEVGTLVVAAVVAAGELPAARTLEEAEMPWLGELRIPPAAWEVETWMLGGGRIAAVAAVVAVAAQEEQEARVVAAAWGAGWTFEEDLRTLMLAVLPFRSAVLPFQSAVLPFQLVVLPFQLAVLPFRSADLPFRSADLPFQLAVLPFQLAVLPSPLPFPLAVHRSLVVRFSAVLPCPCCSHSSVVACTPLPYCWTVGAPASLLLPPLLRTLLRCLARAELRLRPVGPHY